MYMCVRGIGYASVSTIFIFDFKIVPTLFVVFFILLFLFTDMSLRRRSKKKIPLRVGCKEPYVIITPQHISKKSKCEI
jgi:hypothetical protein